MRDKRFVAVHRGGPLTKDNHQKLIKWARVCSEHVMSLIDKDVDIIFNELKIYSGIIARRPNENIREYRLRKLRESGKIINPGTGRYEDDTGKYSSDYPIQITDNGIILDLENIFCIKQKRKMKIINIILIGCSMNQQATILIIPMVIK